MPRANSKANPAFFETLTFSGRVQAPHVQIGMEFQVGRANLKASPAMTLKELVAWLRAPKKNVETYFSELSNRVAKVEVHFDQETGELVCERGSGERRFATDEESLAKFTRWLKALSPPSISHSTELVAELPQPTAEELANAQVYLNAMPAHGIKAPSRITLRKPRPQAVRTREVASLARSRLLRDMAGGGLSLGA